VANSEFSSLLAVCYSPFAPHFAQELSAQGNGPSQKPALCKMSPLFTQNVALTKQPSVRDDRGKQVSFRGGVGVRLREQDPEKFG
jgi:hypothetical protein